MKITKDIKYIGVNDTKIDLFEGLYSVPNGISYNSYVILDEKIAVMDTVDAAFCEEWFNNLEAVLGGKEPDYLVVHHMEPDHSANIFKFASKYPKAVIVASSKAFNIMRGFFGTDFAGRSMIVGEGDTLCLGSHTLKFYLAPMVHWPEVIVSFDETDNVLFSADGFGKFGIHDGEEEWACEARRYYFGIVGKYGAQVQLLLKKLMPLQIKVICPLHGPVLTENIGYYVNLYNVWSSYAPETDGVFIAYTSVYGNTKKAAISLAEQLKEKGVKVAISDLARSDMAEAVEDAFKYSKLVLATTTYNAEIFPFMREFIANLTERNFSNRTVALIENGSWAPTAAKVMRESLSGCKNLTICENTVKIISALNADSEQQLEALAAELAK